METNNIASAKNGLSNKLTDLVKSVEKVNKKYVEQEKTLDREESKKLKLELMELSRKLNNEMKGLKTDITFKYQDDIKGLLVTVKEENGEKVIREIPSKEAIELMKKMRETIGIIFDKEG